MITLPISQILSIQLLLNSNKKKSIYKRVYFNGAEDNWLIIKMKDPVEYNVLFFVRKEIKTYKVEVLLESLETEKNLISDLDKFKKNHIQISYGTKRKFFLHSIRCAIWSYGRMS